MTSLESAAIEKSAEAAKGLFDKIFGPSFEEFGLMLGDNIKIRRLKNQIKNLGKIDKIVSENNITLKQVNLKVLVSYLENVSLEEDETLQNMWANLMTNYVDASQNILTTVYPAILAQLSSEEVRVLSILKEGFQKHYQSLYPAWHETVDRRPLLNLLRLDLIEEVYKIEQGEKHNPLTGMNEFEVKYKSTKYFKITEFGKSLILACER